MIKRYTDFMMHHNYMTHHNNYTIHISYKNIVQAIEETTYEEIYDTEYNAFYNLLHSKIVTLYKRPVHNRNQYIENMGDLVVGFYSKDVCTVKITNNSYQMTYTFIGLYYIPIIPIIGIFPNSLTIESTTSFEIIYGFLNSKMRNRLANKPSISGNYMYKKGYLRLVERDKYSIVIPVPKNNLYQRIKEKLPLTIFEIKEIIQNGELLFIYSCLRVNKLSIPTPYIEIFRNFFQ
jgi:hypothetical protein